MIVHFGSHGGIFFSQIYSICLLILLCHCNYALCDDDLLRGRFIGIVNNVF